MPAHIPPPAELPPERAAVLADLVTAFGKARDRVRYDSSLIRPELLPALRALLAEIAAVTAEEFAGVDVPASLTALADEPLEDLFQYCAGAAMGADPARLTDLALVVREAMDSHASAVDEDRVTRAAYRALDLLEQCVRPGAADTVAACTAAAYDQIGLLMDAGEAAEAIPYSLRALSWCEPFLHANPPIGEDRIAVAHHRHALLLEAVDAPLHALAYSERAVEIYASIVDTDDPAVIDPDDPETVKGYREILNVHIHRLQNAGRHDDARAASTRYIAHVRHPVGRAHALDRHRAILSRLDTAAATTAAHRAVAAWERVAETAEPGAYADELCAAYTALAALLREHGSHDDAADAMLAAARTAYAEIAAGRDPRRDDTETLARVVQQMMAADRYDEAFEWSERELALLRDLMNHGKDLHSGYAKALNNHAVILNGFEEYERSLDMSEQAVMLQQVLSRSDGDEALPLAGSLITRQTALRELRRYDEAMLVCHQALTIHRSLEHRTPHPDPVSLTLAHREFARLLSLTGDSAALPAFTFVVGRLERHAEDDPGLRADLAEALNLQLVAMQSAGESPSTLLPLSERLVRLEEELAGEHPEQRLTELAQALHNHAVQLGDVGRPREAVEHSARAVALYIGLPAAERALPHHLANYANTLDVHANRLAAVGRVEQALDFSAQALEAYDELLAADRHMNLPDAAHARENHALKLEALERIDEAVEHSTRAVVMLEELIADGGPRDRQNLATALSNLANRLMAADRVPEAFTAAERALRIREDMAADAAPEHRADLGISLLNLAKLLIDRGDLGAGASYSSRSIGIFEELIASDRAAYAPLLAQARHNHAEYLAAIGRHDEAAACTRDAVALREELAEKDDLHLEDLTDSLFWAIRYHQEAGRHDLALSYSVRREQVLERRLTAEPEQLRELAEDRLDLARLYSEAGHRLEAAGAARRAVAAVTELAAEDREEHLELLECCLSELARALRPIMLEESCEAAAACLEIAEERDGAEDGHYGLAHALDDYADALCRAGRHEEALSYSARALPMWEELVEEDGPGGAGDLASCLVFRSVSLAATGRTAEALEASTRAVALLREVPDDDPELPQDLALALREHALRLHAVGRGAEAVPAVLEALRRHEAMVAADPRPHRPELAETLLTAARVRAGDALDLAARAVAAYEAAEEDEPGPYAAPLRRAREELARLWGR